MIPWKHKISTIWEPPVVLNRQKRANLIKVWPYILHLKMEKLICIQDALNEYVLDTNTLHIAIQ